MLQSEGQTADHSSRGIADPPKGAEPQRTIIKGVIKVEQERSTGLQFLRAMVQRTLSVRQMMKNAKRIAEVHRAIRQGNVSHRTVMKLDVPEGAEHSFRYGKSFRTRVHTMEFLD